MNNILMSQIFYIVIHMLSICLSLVDIYSLSPIDAHVNTKLIFLLNQALYAAFWMYIIIYKPSNMVGIFHFGSIQKNLSTRPKNYIKFHLSQALTQKNGSTENILLSIPTSHQN